MKRRRNAPKHENIGPYSGTWRFARTNFQCMNRRGMGIQCSILIRPGHKYYDTNEGSGVGHFFATNRICGLCATRLKAIDIMNRKEASE